MSSDLSPLDVERSLLSPRKAYSMYPMTLSFPEEGVAMLVPSSFMRRLGLMFMIGGVVGTVLMAGVLLLALTVFPLEIRLAIAGALALLDLLPIWAGWAIRNGRIMVKNVTFDRRKGRYWRGRDAGDPFDTSRSIGNIAAVQLLSGQASDGESSFDAMELNLVLHEPPRERRHVLTCRADTRLRVEAEQLARFLDVPLLGCADPASRGQTRMGQATDFS